MTGELAAGLLAAVTLAGLVVAGAMVGGKRRRPTGQPRPASVGRTARQARDHLAQLAAQQVPYPPLRDDTDPAPQTPPELGITWHPLSRQPRQ